MSKAEVIEAFQLLARERRVSIDELNDLFHEVLQQMILKRFGTVENFEITVNMGKGEIEIYQIKDVVEEVDNPYYEISIQEARKTEPDIEIGDEFIRVINIDEFKRRIVVQARHLLNQRIRDTEKTKIFDEYSNRIGQITSGTVHQLRRDKLFVRLENAEAVLPLDEQIPTERFRRGDTLKALIKKVSMNTRGPEIVLSRCDPYFLVRLFEMEVPEIVEGIIEIKGVARDPGDRAKVAVESIDDRIDPVGACVGMKGIRIQSIVRELNNEKIDVISFSPEPEIFIGRALSPAVPLLVKVEDAEDRAIAIIPNDQISLAIGKNGQNIHLASIVTGYEIEAIRESEASSDSGISLDEVEGLTQNWLNKLNESGLEWCEDVLEGGMERLTSLPGIGDKSAEKILEAVAYYVTQREQQANAIENETGDEDQE